MIAFDLETHKIQPGLLAPPIVCGTRSNGQPHYMQPGLHPARETAEIVAHARVDFESSRVVAGANIAYDMACLCAADPSLVPLVFDKYERGQVHDVLIAQMLDAIARGYVRKIQNRQVLIDPRTDKPLQRWSPRSKKYVMADRYSLATCVDLVLGRRDAKSNDRYRTSYALLEHTPIAEWPEEARQYPLDDAQNTYEVACVQLEQHLNLHDMAAQVRAAFASHLAAVWGLRTNGARVTALGLALDKKYADALERFKAAGLIRADGSRDMEAIAARVTKAYLGKPPLTPKGKVSSARDVLEESGDELLEELAPLSKVEKNRGTYYPFIVQGVEKPINLAPNPLLANGRQSYDGLIQLLPRKGGIRECFEARPGTVWNSVDYSAIELSTLGQVCLWTVGFSKLAEAINGGTDPHSLFAAKLSSESYETVLAFVKAGDPVWGDRRQMTKAANFGYPGMMGAVKFAISKRKEGLKLCIAARLADRCGEQKIVSWKGRECPPVCKLCVQQAEALRLAYLGMWPEIPQYFRWIEARLASQGDQLEQFVSKRLRGGLTSPSGANTLFSGLAADGAKRALWAVARECYLDRASPLFGSRVVVFAHDEIICEIPEDRAHEASHRQRDIMVEQMQRCVPDVAVKAEPTLMRRWYKDAKPVYTNGRLVPWEPKAAA